MIKKKLIRVATLPMSLNILLKGQLNFLNNYFNVVALSSNGKEMIEIEKRENVSTIVVPMKRHISIFYDIISLLKLVKVFKKENPIIVHSITPKAGLLSMIAARIARVPIRVHTFTGLIFPEKSGFLKYLLIYMDRLLCYFATNVYPEGNGVKKDLIKYNITSKPLSIIGNGNINGIDLNFFSKKNISNDSQLKLKNKLNLNSNDFIFIYIGRIVADKGINELIIAFENISKKDVNIKLLLVGSFESELDPLKKSTIDSIFNNNKIIYCGFQNDVRPYYSIADSLVFPSYREGFPNVVLQAGSMGLPSIVTDINGCNEIIINEYNGLIIRPKNITDLENAMLRMFHDTEILKKCSSNSRSLIIRKFEQKKYWQSLLSEYNNLLNKKNLV